MKLRFGRFAGSLVITLLIQTARAAAPNAADAPDMWLRHPAISPDGSAIAFSYRGDIWVVPAAGGIAVSLTRHPAHDTMPVWSHNGKTLAFASDRYGNFDVFTIPAAGGSVTRVTQNSAADYPSDFSPDDAYVIFSSARTDSRESILFPSSVLGELYRAPVGGGRTEMILTTPAHDARYSPDGRWIAFHDRKGYEDDWRKHHVSSVTRDVWVYDTQTAKYTVVSGFIGEDRSPAWSADGRTLFYLCEQSGSFNVWSEPLPGPSAPANARRQLTHFKDAPVRFLTASRRGDLCFNYRGAVWVLGAGAKEPRRVAITVGSDEAANPARWTAFTSDATEVVLSNDSKQIAFVVRGEVFVASADGKMTKRITNTPEQERNVSFSADGKRLLYCSQRGGTWNLYASNYSRADDLYFYNATLITEETLLNDGVDNQNPRFSPDGKEVAYFAARDVVKVLTLADKSVRTVITDEFNFSYNDGSLWFDWSPDSEWLVASYTDRNRYSQEIGLYRVRGDKTAARNLTHNGYDDRNGRWAMDGTAILWRSDRVGMRGHANSGATQDDVYLQFLTQAAYDRFRLSKQDLGLVKEREAAAAKKSTGKKPVAGKKADEEKKEEAAKTEADAPAEVAATGGEKKDKVADDDDGAKKKGKPVVIDEDGLDERIVRLTQGSSLLADFALSADGEKLVHLSKFDKGYDLWVTRPRDKDTKLVAKLGATRGRLRLDAKGENAFVLADGKLSKIKLDDGKTEAISLSADVHLNGPAERAHIFDHVWRLIDQKFYNTDFHGVNWAALKTEYARFLPSISNNHEFSDLVSEMLGELNASHTGLRYSPKSMPENDATARLAAFFDPAYAGDGLKLTEIVARGPLVLAEAGLKPGHVIEKIDGVLLTRSVDVDTLLNRKAGQPVLLGFLDPADGRRWDAVVKPITPAAERDLLYQRWVKARRADVVRLSGGRLGYVHVRGMDDAGYRQIYEEALGYHSGAEGLVVDTRFNGGGWLHDDLVSFLGGRRYTSFAPRGRAFGEEPSSRWHRPSVVLMSESNYSDAHFFPYAYKTLGIGKLVGMPVPGTSTAVWWENLMDPTLTVGVPEMGGRDLNQAFLENQQLPPDVMAVLRPEDAAAGRDTQIEAAVKVLLSQLPAPAVASTQD
jgi:tricorn protease